jgi:hypothetical protein
MIDQRFMFHGWNIATKATPTIDYYLDVTCSSCNWINEMLGRVEFVENDFTAVVLLKGIKEEMEKHIEKYH